MRAQGLAIKALSIVLTGWYVVLLCPAAVAQSVQFRPESNTYISLGEKTQLWLQASTDRGTGRRIDTQIGPSIVFNLKPLLRLRTRSASQPNKAKSRLLTLAFGYRYIASNGQPENRFLLEANPRFPLPWNVIATDGNKAELRIIAGTFSWRYKNGLTLERGFRAGSFNFRPYVRGEVHHDSNYKKWSDTALCLGTKFPIKKHTEIEPYYQHENHTGRAPNRQVEALGLKLNLYF